MDVPTPVLNCWLQQHHEGRAEVPGLLHGPLAVTVGRQGYLLASAPQLQTRGALMLLCPAFVRLEALQGRECVP